jgi:hypothetical protein
VVPFQGLGLVGSAAPGQSAKSMLSGTASANLPFFHMIRLFADAVYFPEIKDQLGSTSGPLWDVGVSVRVVKDIFEMYMPLATSKELKSYQPKNQVNAVYFSLHLEKLDPISSLRRL